MKISKKQIFIAVPLLIVILAVLFAEVYLEKIAKGILLSKLDDYGIEASIDKMTLGIIRGRFALRGVDLRSKTGEPILAAERTDLNISLMGVLAGKPDLQQASIHNAEAHAMVNEEGEINLLTLFTAQGSDVTPKPEPSEPGTISIGAIELNQVKFTIGDSRKDSPIHSASFSADHFSVNLKRGVVSARNVALETPDRQPSLHLGSASIQGNLTYPFQSPLRLTQVEIDGLQGKSLLNEKGQPIIQVWLEDLARQNQLMDPEEAETPASTGNGFELPEKVVVKNLDFELGYPGENKEVWVDTLKLANLQMDSRRNTLEASHLEWTNNRSLLAQVPVLKLDQLQLTGDLLSDQKTIDRVSTQNLQINLVKDAQKPQDLIQRMDRLSTLLASSSEAPATNETQQADSLRIKGVVNLESLHLRCLVTNSAAGEQVDNILKAARVSLDFDQGALRISQLALSDEQGSFQNPALQIKDISARGSLQYPLPTPLRLEIFTVDNPVIHLAKKGDEEINLTKRIAQITDQGKPDTEKPSDSDFKLEIKRLEIRDGDLVFLHQLESGQQVRYEAQPAEVFVDDLVYPKGGTGWTNAEVAANLIAPSTGQLSLQARLQQRDFPKTFEGKMAMNLFSIASLEPYYGERLPVRIVSGSLAISADGKSQGGRLDIPYSFQIISPQLEPARRAGVNPFQGLSNVNAQVLANSLKDEKGDLTYRGRITGTISEPQFGSPFEAMGNILGNQLQTNLRRLPDLVRTLGSPADAAGDAARGLRDGVGTVGESVGGALRGLFAPGSRERREQEQQEN